MDILINGKAQSDLPDPEPEESVIEYTERINQEFAPVNRVVQVDSINRQPVNSDSLERNVLELERLDLSVKTIQSVAVDSLIHLAEYLDQALENFPEIIDDWLESDEQQRREHIRQLEEAFDAIDQILSSLPSMIDLEDHLETIQNFEEELSEVRQLVDEETSEQLLEEMKRTQELFHQLRSEIETIIQHLSQQHESLLNEKKKYTQSISEYTEKIPSLVEKLQSSPTRETYDEVEEILGLLEGTLGFMNSLDQAGKIKLMLSPDEQKKLSTVHTELDTGIDELSRAFEEEDVVMICDILEYEIQPYLEKIEEFLKQIELAPNRN